ncbi:MAG: hypothetical protein ACI808_000587 [Paraglaciecola sp.]|jgi:hypothetical protein
MKKLFMVSLAFLSMSAFANEIPLAERMKALDTELFESFNNCHDPKELDNMPATSLLM